MIDRILIKDYLNFKNVELNFKEGLSVFTGVSGAGKSVLMSAIMAVFGLKDSEARLIEADVEHKFEIETPFMLDVTLHKNDGKTEKKIAFNDAVIVSKNGGSMTHIEALLNEKYFNSYFGDGVIVATPAGTTAYNMSANGPIIYPLSEVFALTPICSHSLTQRPVVLTKNHTVKFRTNSDAILVIDGQDRFDMSKISAVSMSLSDKKARLIRHIGRDYFQILKEKLHWGYND